MTYVMTDSSAVRRSSGPVSHTCTLVCWACTSAGRTLSGFLLTKVKTLQIIFVCAYRAFLTFPSCSAGVKPASSDVLVLLFYPLQSWKMLFKFKKKTHSDAFMLFVNRRHRAMCRNQR